MATNTNRNPCNAGRKILLDKLLNEKIRFNIVTKQGKTKKLCTIFTMCSHPTRITNTMTIILAASGIVLTFTNLTTIRSIVTVRTRYITAGSRPTGCTLTLARYVITFGTIFAHTLQSAMWPVRIRRTRMFAHRANVTGTTHIFAGHMITCLIAVDNCRTFFLASYTIIALVARFIAIVTRPATGAYTFARLRITR